MREGGRSGVLELALETYGYVLVCSHGFDDDAGDVACRQLGFVQSSDIFTSHNYMYVITIIVRICKLIFANLLSEPNTSKLMKINVVHSRKL